MARLTVIIDGFTFDVRNPDEALVWITEEANVYGPNIIISLKTLRRAMDQINKGWKGSRK